MFFPGNWNRENANAARLPNRSVSTVAIDATIRLLTAYMANGMKKNMSTYGWKLMSGDVHCGGYAFTSVSGLSDVANVQRMGSSTRAAMRINRRTTASAFHSGSLLEMIFR